jgi:hypothetical protein
VINFGCSLAQQFDLLSLLLMTATNVIETLVIINIKKMVNATSLTNKSSYQYQLQVLPSLVGNI